MKSKNYCARPLFGVFFVFLCAFSVFAQTAAFTYQGRLTDGVMAANGTYEMQFRLFDAESTGT